MTPAADAFLLSVHVKNKRGAFFFLCIAACTFLKIWKLEVLRNTVENLYQMQNPPKLLLNISNFSKIFSLYFLFDNHEEY